jgi:hypothetical protein
MSAERKALLILIAIAVSESLWVYFSFRHAGFQRMSHWFGADALGNVSILGWAAALLTAALFCLYALRLPSVAASLWTLTGLKLAAVAVAISSGLCEEGVFRKMLMNTLATHHHGWGYQIAISALLFGAAHGIWGLFRGSIGAAVGATAATAILGAMLAIVFLLSGRNAFPSVCSHAAINLIIEPGLVLAAIRGEMGYLRGASQLT